MESTACERRRLLKRVVAVVLAALAGLVVFCLAKGAIEDSFIEHELSAQGVQDTEGFQEGSGEDASGGDGECCGKDSQGEAATEDEDGSGAGTAEDFASKGGLEDGALEAEGCPIVVEGTQCVSIRSNAIGRAWDFTGQEDIESAVGEVLAELEGAGYALEASETLDLFGDAWGCIGRSEGEMLLVFVRGGEDSGCRIAVCEVYLGAEG